MKKVILFRVITLSALVFWMGLIFSFSAQNAKESSAVSGRVILKIVKYFYPAFDDLSSAARAELMETLQFYVRKAAHLSLYAVLGFLSFLTVVSYRKFSFFLRAIMSFSICFTYSLLDELHQTFVAGRSGEFRDVLIDNSGALISILLLCLLCFLIQPIKRRVK